MQIFGVPATGLWAVILAIVYILTFLVSFAVIFLERKDPAATLAWLMILYILPGIGLLLYVFFSQNISRYKLNKRSFFEARRTGSSLSTQMDDMAGGRFDYSCEEARKWRQLVKMNQKYAESYYTQDNEIEIFTGGQKLFTSLCEDIKNAKRCINLESYIIRPGKICTKIIDLLTEKAKSGVEVRLLVDDCGSRKFRPEDCEKLIAAGGKVARYFPAKIFKLNIRLNYRNHRKICVVDNRIAYLGGFNIADEYLGLPTEKWSGWRDTHARIRGGCVEDVEARFLLDWRFASKEAYYIDNSIYHSHGINGRSGVQIIAGGPDSKQEENKFQYLYMINHAERSIYLQTPYFIPTNSIYEGLKAAALSGVDVNLMIPDKPDNPFVYWVTYANAASLMKYGVKTYTYNAGFMHAKTLVVDDEVCSVGSANFDIRSFSLDFECNAMIYGKECASTLRKAFIDDISHSTLLTPEIYAKRPITVKIKESVGRLASNIL